MKNPNPINLKTPEDVRGLGWAAEARDADGHLRSMLAWPHEVEKNENAIMLAEFIQDYSPDCTITLFPENIK